MGCYPAAGSWEPDDARVSRPVLREAEGEIPSAYSPVYPNGQGLRLSGGCDRLVQSAGLELAGVDLDGDEPSRTRCIATAHPRSSIPIRAASSPAKRSPACSSSMASRSAWTARVAGATTCLWNGFGNPSSMKKSTCAPTTRYHTPKLRSAGTSPSTTHVDRTAGLRGEHRIRFTSTRCCPYPRQHDYAENPLIQTGLAVQTSGATSLRRRRRRRLPQRMRQALVQPLQPNHCWSLDFMGDTLINRRA